MDYTNKDKSFFIEKFYTDYYGVKWNYGKDVVTITYSFPTSSLRTTTNGLSTNLIREFTSSEIEIITSTINLWDNELETIEFKYVEDDKFANLTFGLTYIDGYGKDTNYGYWESFWEESKITFGVIRFENEDLEFLTLRQISLHEIGNILGLGDIYPSSDFESVMEDPQQVGDYSANFTLSNFDKSMIKTYYDEVSVSKTSLKYELSETVDTTQNTLFSHSENTLSGTINFNSGDNIIILDGQGKNYRGLSGDDTYFVSQLIPKNTKLSITDTDGVNIIQIPANTYVDKSLFTKNAARLTIQDGREITINSADKFSYNVGGNITNGTKGTDLNFTEFAEVFGVYDILNSSGAQTGVISDMYII